MPLSSLPLTPNTDFKMGKEDNVITAYPNYAPTAFTQVRSISRSFNMA